MTVTEDLVKCVCSCMHSRRCLFANKLFVRLLPQIQIRPVRLSMPMNKGVCVCVCLTHEMHSKNCSMVSVIIHSSTSRLSLAISLSFSLRVWECVRCGILFIWYSAKWITKRRIKIEQTTTKIKLSKCANRRRRRRKKLYTAILYTLFGTRKSKPAKNLLVISI